MDCGGRKRAASCKSKRVPWWFVLLPCSSICSASSSSSSPVMDHSTTIVASSEMVDSSTISLPFPESSALDITEELVCSPTDDEGPSEQQQHNLCTICLDPLLSSNDNSPSSPGTGAAVFKAQCSHSFHLSCISSNIQHGSLTCPICRAHWTLQPPRSPHRPSWVPRASQNRSISPASRAQRRSRPRAAQYYNAVDSIEHSIHARYAAAYHPPPLTFSLVSLAASSPLSQQPYNNNYHHCYSRCQCSLDCYRLSTDPSLLTSSSSQGRVIFQYSN